MSEPYVCPCCGENTLPNEAAYDRCPVCGWMDDGSQAGYSDEDGCANVDSLNEHKAWWEKRKHKEERTAISRSNNLTPDLSLISLPSEFWSQYDMRNWDDWERVDDDLFLIGMASLPNAEGEYFDAETVEDLSKVFKGTKMTRRQLSFIFPERVVSAIEAARKKDADNDLAAQNG